jgi:hypothetical protein
MRAFLVELGYFLGTLWSKTWRWALRKRRNLAISVAVVIVLLMVTGAIVQGTSTRPEVKPTPTPTPTSTEVYTEVTAAPIDGGAGTPTPEPTEAVDEAETVARQWATDYLERPSDEDTAWKEKVGAYTIPTVLEQLDAQAFRPEGILDGKAPTEIIEVTFSDPQEGAETNTPVRWSRTLIASVKGQDGSTAKITFGVVLMKGETGWMVTHVEEISLEG